MSKKIVIGVTGGVGSGKSVVMSYLEEQYQAKIILADLVAHDLMQPGEKNYEDIVETFGEKILDQSREIDRRKLGQIVFEDQDKLEKLNQITHPNVRTEIEHRIALAQEDPDIKIICLEAALIIEEGYQELLDELWYIFVEKEIRIERLKAGRGYSREKCLQIMSSQLSDAEFINASDRVINNSGSEEETRMAVDQVMEQIYG